MRANEFVGNSNETDAAVLDRLLSFAIALDSTEMDSAVYFDRKPRLSAVEIHNVSGDRVLATELQSVEPTATQFCPE
jgi:hypothetical protein